MARRRVGAPQAAAGDVWRQQQQLAALAGALQQLPRGDALPLVLLRGLQRMLACVEHTLQGPPSCPGAGTATGSGSGDGGCSGPAAAKVEPLTDAAAAEGAAVPSDMREVGVEHLKSVTEGRVQDASSREAMAAARAVGILQDLLASVADGNGGSGGDGDGGCGPLYYAEALLHNFLALSSDLFDVITVECRTAVSVGSRTPVAASNGDGDGSHGWRGFRRDELAAAARRKLPAGVYVRIVAALGWDARLLDLLAWLPHPAVASAALARAMELHSAIAPAIAEALLGAGAGCAGAADLDRDAAGSPSWAHRMASNPRVVLSVAHSVRQAAAKELSGGADKPAWDGRRWLPCLLLLGRALAQTLRRRLASTAAAAAVAVTATAGGDCAGDDQWEDACCEALQEGLCVCQADILAASGAAKTAAADADAVAATATALLQLVQGELAGLLDEQRGGGGVVGAPHGLLSHGSALRLRTRIMLLGMQAASASAAANAPPPPISATAAAAAAAAGNAQLLPRPELPTGEGTVRLAAEDVWRDLPYGSAAAGPVAAMADPSGPGPAPGQAPAPLAPAGAEGPGRPQTRRLPDWLRAASLAAVAPSGAPRAGGGTDALQLLLSRGAVKNAMTAAAAAAPAVPAPAPSAAATARAAAAAVALLTPGLGSWLRVQSDPRVGSAAGPDPYSPFRMALALLELLQGLQGPGGGARSGADPDAAGSAVNAAVGGDGGTGPGAPAGGLCGGAEVERVEAARQLELQVLRMAAECLACVGAPEQQAALQAVVLDSPDFASLRARLAADAALQAAACRALVALSNRAAAVEGSLERLALSAQQEAERLAAAATNLLPYAVLVPEACIRRLVLDGLTHPGQQPWVLQLLRCFAVAAAAPAAAAGAPAPAAPVPMLLSCVWDVVLGDAARWLRTAAERRSLLGLLGGLLRAGLLAPRQLLSALVEPALSGTAEGGRRSVPQVYCGLLVAQLVMGGSETAGLPPAAYCPMTELAAARPARLLLAAAAALGELYDTYTGSRRLEAAAIDAAATVLERAVQLYGTYLSTTRHEGDVGELRDLSEGCATLPRHPVAVLLPLLELAAASSQGDDGAGGGDDGDEGDGGGIRALSAWFAPATRWRPRGLRTADANLARAVLVDTLAFATSSAANATAVRLALLDAAAAAEDGADEVGEARNAAPCVWSAWGDVLPHDDGGAVAAPMGRRDEDVEGVIARHVAATAARGLPQLPAPMLLQGSVQAVAELLPTASPEQARRLLLGLLPAVVQAAGGGAALHAALEEAGAAEGLPTAGALSMEVMRTCLLAPVMRRGGGAAAAAVALSMALACRAAAAALRAAAAADAAAVASAPALLPAVGDRCAAHLALLASRLSAAASASARTLDGAGGGGGSLGVAAIAVVLLSELCGVATVAWELASPGNDRALDVWQAILLSVLQCLVAALAVSEPPLRPLPAAAAAAASDVRQLLRSALRALRTLPNPAAAVLQGSLERLCEEQEPHSDQQEDRGAGAAGGGGGGGLSAALHAVMSEDGGRDVEYVLR